MMKILMAGETAAVILSTFFPVTQIQPGDLRSHSGIARGFIPSSLTWLSLRSSLGPP